MKTATFGYDGRGWTLIEPGPELYGQCAVAWSRLGQPMGVLERLVRFDLELSVSVARVLLTLREARARL